MSTIFDEFAKTVKPHIDSHASTINKKLDKIVRKFTEENDWSSGNNKVTDASGNADIIICEVPEGQELDIVRIVLWSDAHTPANPWANAATWFTLNQGGIYTPASIFDIGPFPAGGTVFPGLRVYQQNTSPVIRGPERALFHLVGGPLTTNVSVLVFGTLKQVHSQRL